MLIFTARRKLDDILIGDPKFNTYIERMIRLDVWRFNEIVEEKP